MPDFARLRAKRLFLLDLDGTLYLDERLFDGAADFLRAIHSRGGTYRFLTNNSSRGAESYVEKLRTSAWRRRPPTSLRAWTRSSRICTHRAWRKSSSTSAARSR